MRARRMGEGRRRPHGDARGARAASSSSRPIWCCWRWGSSGRGKPGLLEQAGVALDPRGNVLANTNDYRTSVRQGLRRRRHAARPVAGGVGDPRRPAMRARGRRVPDGQQHAAAVSSAWITGARLTSESAAHGRACSGHRGMARYGWPEQRPAAMSAHWHPSGDNGHALPTSTSVSLKHAPSARSARMSADTSADIV